MTDYDLLDGGHYPLFKKGKYYHEMEKYKKELKECKKCWEQLKANFIKWFKEWDNDDLDDWDFIYKIAEELGIDLEAELEGQK